MNNRIAIIKNRYGPDCFKKWGKKGAQKFWEKYTLIPVDISMFAIVNRKSGKIVSWLNGICPDDYNEYFT